MSDEEMIAVSYDEHRILKRIPGLAHTCDRTSIVRAPSWAKRIAGAADMHWVRSKRSRWTAVEEHVYVASFAIRTARRDLAARVAILAIVDAEPDAREAVEAYLTSIGVDL